MRDAQHPAFAALSPWIDDGLDALTTDRLDHLAATCDSSPVTASGARIRFVAPNGRASARVYESRIHDTGEVATRPGSAHDAFNALCWLAFPRTKRACNALHVAHAANGGEQRGPVRDALTLFDESGVIALCSEPSLAALLVARQWKAVFHDRRDAAKAGLRFLVCGHALYEKLLRPYSAITGRVLIVPVDAATIERNAPSQRRIADAATSDRLRSVQSATDLPPLPLAGVPGWDPRNEDAGFYDDLSVFRRA